MDVEGRKVGVEGVGWDMSLSVGEVWVWFVHLAPRKPIFKRPVSVREKP